jgi:hypothetical protein
VEGPLPIQRGGHGQQPPVLRPLQRRILPVPAKGSRAPFFFFFFFFFFFAFFFAVAFCFYDPAILLGGRVMFVMFSKVPDKSVFWICIFILLVVFDQSNVQTRIYNPCQLFAARAYRNSPFLSTITLCKGIPLCILTASWLSLCRGKMCSPLLQERWEFLRNIDAFNIMSRFLLMQKLFPFFYHCVLFLFLVVTVRTRPDRAGNKTCGWSLNFL